MIYSVDGRIINHKGVVGKLRHVCVVSGSSEEEALANALVKAKEFDPFVNGHIEINSVQQMSDEDILKRINWLP